MNNRRQFLVSGGTLAVGIAGAMSLARLAPTSPVAGQTGIETPTPAPVGTPNECDTLPFYDAVIKNLEHELVSTRKRRAELLKRCRH